MSIFERRDFLREAVSFLITPILAALSSSLYTDDKSFVASASFFSCTSFTKDLTVFFIERLRRSLKARLRASDLILFFADARLAIAGDTISKLSKKGNICYYECMISTLRGIVSEKALGYVVVEAGGVGYQIFAPMDTLSSLSEGKEAFLFVYDIVRETTRDLYGFKDQETREFFQLLLEVPGIGPKSALAVLNVATVLTLQKAIGGNDTAYLTKVSGIVRKTAEKIVVTLKDKLSVFAGEGGALSEEGDVMEALKSLGYREHEIREVLKKLPEETTGANDRIKKALRILGQS